MAEWFKAAVLKTVGSERGPGVRIPLSPPAASALVRASRVAALSFAIMAGVSQTTSAGQVPNEQAPSTFRARFDTSQGAFVIDVQREWAPLAADRFFTLVKSGFYDGARFFRVLTGFMAQFGLNGDPTVQAAWASANLVDEPPKQSNLRGFVTFAKESSPNSRYTMVFVNYTDNSYLDADGFAPFGQVVEGMDVVDKLYGGYGRTNVPDQRRIKSEGNAYLRAEFPRLDFIKKATIERPK
jgi:peptidyl-prolyl cis-trans isomerase A (cyclophilin A)